MTLAPDIMYRLDAREMTLRQAWAMQEARASTVATIDPQQARARATALVNRKVIESPLGPSLVAACARLGIHIEMRECYTGYGEAVEGVRNLVTWGMKRPHEWYLAGGRNVLFIENGLLCQRHGAYVDAAGYFADSSVVTDRQQPTPAEIARLREHGAPRTGLGALGRRGPARTNPGGTADP